MEKAQKSRTKYVDSCEGSKLNYAPTVHIYNVVFPRFSCKEICSEITNQQKTCSLRLEQNKSMKN